MENTVKFCIVFLMLFKPVVPIDSKFCNWINGKLECCTGYKLNPERNNCILTMENTVKFCIVFLMLFQPVVPIDSKFCNGFNGKLECCTGYKLNPKRNNCIPCDRGFLGDNCVTKCLYPTYGEDCQSECYCNVTYCDHVSGCTETSEEHFSKHLSNKTITKALMNKVNIVESSFSATVENTTIFYYPKKTQSKMSFTLMLAIIGLTVVFLIVIMMYIFTGLFEKC